MKEQQDESSGRILLGDNIGGWGSGFQLDSLGDPG
jgi:hypothetical protein